MIKYIIQAIDVILHPLKNTSHVLKNFKLLNFKILKTFQYLKTFFVLSCLKQPITN